MEATNTVERFEYQDSRFYWKNGEAYPSVTTILSAYPKPFLAEWRGNLGNEEANRQAKEAADKGSFVHDAFHRALTLQKKVKWYTAQGADPYKDIVVEEQFAFMSLYKLAQWFDAVKPEILLTEQKIYSDSLGYAGTVDLLMRVDQGTYMVNGSTPLKLEQGIYIADIKTGRYVGEEAKLQLAAYAHALCEADPDLRIKGGLILHTQSLNRKGIQGMGTILVADLGNKMTEFLKVYEVWKLYNTSKPEPLMLPAELDFNYNITNR